MINNPNFVNLMNDYVADFRNNQNLPFVVPNSIPVIWFGDIDAYAHSDRKIITVSLNPSLHEFPANGLQRFNVNALQNVPAQATAQQLRPLYDTLNAYFETNPYTLWFNSYNWVLNQLNATYYVNGNMPYKAIHIDAYSAIATNPTWGGLIDNERNQINRVDLSQRLIEILNPEIILISTNQVIFNQLFPANERNQILNFPIGHHGYIRMYSWNERTVISGLANHGLPFNMGHDAMQPVLAGIAQNLHLFNGHN